MIWPKTESSVYVIAIKFSLLALALDECTEFAMPMSAGELHGMNFSYVGKYIVIFSTQ